MGHAARPAAVVQDEQARAASASSTADVHAQSAVGTGTDTSGIRYCSTGHRCACIKGLGAWPAAIGRAGFSHCPSLSPSQTLRLAECRLHVFGHGQVQVYERQRESVGGCLHGGDACCSACSCVWRGGLQHSTASTSRHRQACAHVWCGAVRCQPRHHTRAPHTWGRPPLSYRNWAHHQWICVGGVAPTEPEI